MAKLNILCARQQQLHDVMNSNTARMIKFTTELKFNNAITSENTSALIENIFGDEIVGEIAKDIEIEFDISK